MMMVNAVLDAPSRSTSVCNGRVRWFFPAAVMIARLISKVLQRLTKLWRGVNGSWRGTLQKTSDQLVELAGALTAEQMAANPRRTRASRLGTRAEPAAELQFSEG